MSLIGKEISDFAVQAFTGNGFKEIKKSVSLKYRVL